MNIRGYEHVEPLSLVDVDVRTFPAEEKTFPGEENMRPLVEPPPSLRCKCGGELQVRLANSHKPAK